MKRLTLNKIAIDFEQKEAKNMFLNMVAIFWVKLYEVLNPDFQNEEPKIYQIHSFISEFLINVSEVLTAQIIKSQDKKFTRLSLYSHCLWEIKDLLEKIMSISLDEKLNKMSDEELSDKFRLNLTKDTIKAIAIRFMKRTNGFDPVLKNFEALDLIYTVRIYLLLALDRELYLPYYYFMQKIILNSKFSNESFSTLKLYKTCEKFKDSQIPYFELEKAKDYIRRLNGSQAIELLEECLPEVKERIENIENDDVFIGTEITKVDIIKQMQFLILKTKTEMNAIHNEFVGEFDRYLETYEDDPGEDALYIFAKYIDDIQKKLGNYHENKIKYILKWTDMYLQCISKGDKYLWQALPRVLEIWFEASKLRSLHLIETKLRKLKTYQIAQIIKTLLSNFANDRWSDLIAELCGKVAQEYPYQSAWWIYHLVYFDFVASSPEELKSASLKVKETDRKKRIEFAKKVMSYCGDEITSTKSFFCSLIEFAQQIKGPVTSVPLPSVIWNIDFTKEKVLIPLNKFIQPLMPDSSNIDDFSVYNKDLVFIESIENECKVLQSVERPVKITINGTDGKQYNFLLKWDTNGDMVKESRIIDFANYVNNILKHDSECKKLSLNLHTYSIMPLSKKTGLIEWMDNTSTLKTLIYEQQTMRKIKWTHSHVEYKIKREGKKLSNQEFWDSIMKMSKGVLWHHLETKFPNSVAMTDARARFIMSTSVWSIVGYIIGLGDRHFDNILMHLESGESSHVDFGIIFERGKTLPVPEIVPFRLTKNIKDVFGVLAEKGMFSKTCEVVLKALCKNKNNIIGFLSCFVQDPLSAGKNQSSKSPAEKTPESIISTIEEKLSIDKSLDFSEKSTAYSTMVRTLIAVAQNEGNLKHMYPGWCPYL